MTEETLRHRERRGLAVAFALCGLATLTLLASHPESSAQSFSALLQDEASKVLIDGVVHGGFIVTLVALITSFAFFARYLGSAKPFVVIGLVTFCTGAGALIASMLVDGFVTPAIAARFAGADGTDGFATAKTLFIFCGTLIRVLMPMGILFQSVAMLSWSSVLVTGRGLRRAIGAFGIAAALSLIVALFAVPAVMGIHVVLGGIMLQATWYFGLAALLLSRDSAT